MSILYRAFGFVLFQIYNFVQNYGVAIILFTLLVNVCLLPLAIKQTKSMKEMQALRPELQKLQKKYKNNPEKLNQETMKLYKLYNVSPMAGCLPLLIQLPIIYALFGALRDPARWVFTSGSTEAVSQSFAWIPNMSEPDPFVILPLLCIVFTFITQKFTMSAQKGTMDPSAEKSQQIMLYIMPVMIGVAAWQMPAGVALYWVVRNIFTFIQQVIMLRKPAAVIDPREAERKVEEAKREEIKRKKEERRQQSEARADAMAAQMGKPVKKKEAPEDKKPLTRPASGKKVKRKTITKIPQRDDHFDKK
ncbi:MAG: membrane protein insertase YidC [Eubacterium sp.]|nr:membrane protein insertase YidC [Eubacterium sp.]